jgi:hypothetical protein
MMNNYERAYAETLVVHRLLNFQMKSKNIGKVTKFLNPKNIFFGE